MVAEEGRLAPSGIPGAEDVQTEELGDRDRCRDGAPEDGGAQQDRQVLDSSDEQRDRECEQRVLAQLECGHDTAGEEVVVHRGGSDRLESEPGQEQSAHEPEAARGAQAPEPVALGAAERRDHDGEQREVREPDVDRGRADPDGKVRLEALVQEEKRQGECEEQRPDRVPVDEDAADPAGGYARGCERRVRHRRNYRVAPGDALPTLILR